jgi:hypothetical protein
MEPMQREHKIQNAGSAKVLVFLICLLLQNIYGSGDSLKNRYSINDPRNPKCPCRKYQKLADKEYAKLSKKEVNQIMTIGRTGSLSRKNTVEVVPRRTQNKKFKFFSGRNRNYKQEKFKIQKNKKRSLKLFFRKDIAACFR